MFIKEYAVIHLLANLLTFYPHEFLKTAFYVVVEHIPKPDFAGLREIGLSDFIDMDVAGITYKNTYYLLHITSCCAEFKSAFS